MKKKLRLCLQCGYTSIDEKENFCPNCGISLIDRCLNCGSLITHPLARYCPVCGKEYKILKNSKQRYVKDH